jgi:hypothetical protein
VLTIAKQTPSANGRYLLIAGSLLQVNIAETFAVSAKVNLATRQVTGTTSGIATGTITGTFATDWSSAEGKFTSTQAGKTAKGSFTLAKAKAPPYDLRGTYKGSADDGSRLSLSITKQSAAGVLTGTATSGKLRFDVLGLVDRSGTGYLYLQGDGSGTFLWLLRRRRLALAARTSDGGTQWPAIHALLHPTSLMICLALATSFSS